MKGAVFMRKKFIKGIVLTLTCVGMMGLFTACSSDDEYRDTLNSGLDKYYNNEDMTKQEHDAVENFNNWKDKQGEKKYSDWD